MDVNGIWNVFQRHKNGTVEKLTPSNGRYYLPCIRPDGKYVVCQGGDFNDYLRIWRIELSTKKIKCVSPKGISGWMPSYSWSGEQIVFSSESKPESELTKIRDMHAFFGPNDTIPMSIYVCDNEGHNAVRLTSGKYMDLRPTFSPDADRIAFISKRTGTWKLWEVATDGTSDPEMIQGKYTWAMRPWYSADGNKIFFHTDIENKQTIVRYNKASGTIIPLSNDTIGHTHGSFTLKRYNTILAHSNRGGTHGIWKFPLDGSDPTEIVINQIDIKAHATMSDDGILTFDSPQDMDPT